jgi:hypothetical protein
MKVVHSLESAAVAKTAKNHTAEARMNRMLEAVLLYVIFACKRCFLQVSMPGERRVLIQAK